MSLCHIVTRQMVSDPTFAMSRAMAPPSQNERTLMTASVMPMDGPVAQTMAHIAAAILGRRGHGSAHGKSRTRHHPPGDIMAKRHTAPLSTHKSQNFH